MKKFDIKRGMLVSLLLSSLVTFPRLLNLNGESFYIMIRHFFYMFTLLLLFWMLSVFFIQKKNNKILHICLYLFISGGISIFYHLFVTLFYEDHTLLFSDRPLIRDMNSRQRYVVLFFRGITFSGFVYFVAYYLNLLEERQRAMLEIETLKKESIEAQLNSLQQQISPHFLFNSLSTLRSIVPDINSKDYILKLSNVFRYLLSFNEKNLGTVREELDFIQSYLYILKERFEDALEVTIVMDKSVLNKMIPPLALQLLIENAIKHNVASFDEPLKIKVYNEANDFLIVSNNLQSKISTGLSTGKGLENISARYRLLSDKTIEIIHDEKFFTVKMPFLINTGQDP